MKEKENILLTDLRPETLGTIADALLLEERIEVIKQYNQSLEN